MPIDGRIMNGANYDDCMEFIDRKTAELFRNNDTIIKSIIKNEYDSDSSMDCGQNAIALKTAPKKFHSIDIKPRLTTNG